MNGNQARSRGGVTPPSDGMAHPRDGVTPPLRALAGCLLLAALLTLLPAAPGAASPSRRSVSTLREGGTAWSKIGAAGGAPVHALDVEPGTPARLYAGTYGAGLWITSNGGTAWNNPLAANVAALCLAPGASGTAYAGAWTEGALKSSDHGAHWTAIVTGLAANDVYALAVDPANADTLYAGTEAGVFKSTDAGAHWLNSAGGPSGTVHALAFAGQTLVAGTDSGAWRTAGGTWQAADDGLGANEVYALSAVAGTVYAGTERGVSVSTDGALHWQPGPAGLPVGLVRVLAADSTGRAVLAGTDQGVYVSEQGAGWQALNQGLSGWALAIGALALDTSQATWQVYAGTADGVWQLSWAPYSTPTPTPSLTPTATVSRTPTPSVTPLVTVTPTPASSNHMIWLPRALKRNP
jgi:ligand-binding sensor domain-containing protein